jgi:prepilin-type processing-associated H-X9-DG protein
VQAAREASRRLQCANNIKQIALALHNYEANHLTLPAAGTYADEKEARSYDYHHQRVDLQSGTNYSWLVQLLPYLEEDALFQQFDFSVPVTRNPGEPQANQPPSLLCPSDDARGRFFERTEPDTGRVVQFGKGNYAAFVNPFHTDSWFYSGAIWLYGQRTAQITDGTSQTLALSEVRTREHLRDERGVWALPWSGASLLGFDMHAAKPAGTDGCAQFACQELTWLKNENRTTVPKYSPWLGSKGFTQRPNGSYPDIIYDCPERSAAQLERMPCDDFAGSRYMSASPRSSHIDGVNVAFLDGRVEFLLNDTDEMAMAIMISTNDGLSVSEAR